jgi:hypothetical protein
LYPENRRFSSRVRRKLLVDTGFFSAASGEAHGMELLILFIVLALIFGIGGLIKGVFWAILIGVVLLLVGVFSGLRAGGRRTTT